MILLSQVVELALPTTVRRPPCSESFIPSSTLTDITYASLAKSFNQSLVHHPETLKRMAALSRIRKLAIQQNPEQRTAQQRMALFPEKAEVLFVGEDIWVVSHCAAALSNANLTCIP